jgi:hypothetical protein
VLTRTAVMSPTSWPSHQPSAPPAVPPIIASSFEMGHHPGSS